MNATPIALEWIEFAEHDYLTVQTLRKVSKVPFEIVAYHCQQLAEKYLKAILIQNNLPVPFIHDLAKLSRNAQEVLPSLADLDQTCELLTPFGTATRYPGSTMPVGAEHLPSVVASAEKIRKAGRAYFGLSE